MTFCDCSALQDFENYDPRHRGPTRTRGLTDVAFLVIIGLILSGWVAIAVFALSNVRSSSGYEAPLSNISEVVSFSLVYILSGTPSTFFSDVNTWWYMIPVGVLLAAPLSVFWMVLILKFTARLVWISVGLLVGCFALGAIGMFVLGYHWLDCILPLTIAIIIGVVARNLKDRINLSADLIQEGCRAVLSFKTTLIFPVVVFVLYLLAFALWATVLVYLYNGTNISMSTKFCQTYNTLCFILMMWFLDAIMILTVSGVCSGWFWVLDKTQHTQTLLRSSLHIALRYHMGTAVAGSVILSVVAFLGILREFEEGITLLSLTELGLQYLFAFIAVCVVNAFVLVSEYGNGFFRSLQMAWSLLKSNICQVFVLNQVIRVVFYALPITLTIGIFIGILVSAESGHTGATKRIFVMYCAGVIAVSLFFNLLEAAVDTVYISVLEDLQRNDGSADKPYFMSERLQSLFVRKPPPVMVFSLI